MGLTENQPPRSWFLQWIQSEIGMNGPRNAYGPPCWRVIHVSTLPQRSSGGSSWGSYTCYSTYQPVRLTKKKLSVRARLLLFSKMSCQRRRYRCMPKSQTSAMCSPRLRRMIIGPRGDLENCSDSSSSLPLCMFFSQLLCLP